MAIDVGGFIEGIGDGAADVVSSAWDRVPGSEIIDDLTRPFTDVVDWWWDHFRYVSPLGPYIAFAETAYKIAKALNQGKSVGRAVGDLLSDEAKSYARQLQKKAPYVAMVPGVGTGVAIAMNAAAAIALGQPVDQMALDAAALSVPGGPVAQQAFRTGANIGAGMIRGESFDEIATREARDVLRRQIGDVAAVAFDAGLALARGKSLQDTGFQTLYFFTKGNELADRAAHFAEAVAKGAREGRSVGDVLGAQLGVELRQRGVTSDEGALLARRLIDRGDLGDVSKQLVETQNYAETLNRLAGKYGVKPEAVRAALASITYVESQGPNGKVVTPQIDEGLLRNFDPAHLATHVPAKYAIRNTRLIRPVLQNVRMPLWLAQTQASLKAYVPPAVEVPAALPSERRGAGLVATIAQPLLLAFPIWLSLFPSTGAR